MINLLNPRNRIQVLEEINTNDNKKRKNISLAEFEVYQDDLMKYVKRYLRGLYSEKTIEEMPVIATVNLAKRAVNQEASIYKTPPKRTFVNVTPEQELVLNKVYKDLAIDVKLLKSNRYFKLQGQNHIQILPFQGKLMARVLLNHHLDVVPMLENPEIAEAYIVNGYDKSNQLNIDAESDGVNQAIGDQDDYKGTLQRFAVWSDVFNFIMDGRGNIVSGEAVENPLGLKPFVEVSPDKDFEYWVRRGQAVTDFTIQYNGALTDLGHVVRMQGFAQAYLKGPENLIPENLQIGPNMIVRLVVDPNNPVDTEFGFANPNSDIQGSIAFIEMLLSNFLTSRGLDPKLVSGKGESVSYASGIERLLAMFEKFDASRSDLSTYEQVEKQIFKIVVRYLNVMAGSVLNYNVSPISEDADVIVEFQKPEMVQSESDKLDNIAKKKELGLISEVDAIQEYHGLDREQAEEKKAEIDQEMRAQLPVV
jgi:hypothetical protein